MKSELGVEFRCVFDGDADERTLDDFIDLVESRGWQYGGSWTPGGMSGCVEFGVPQQAEAERCKAALMAWFTQAQWIASVPELKLIDLDEINGEV